VDVVYQRGLHTTSEKETTRLPLAADASTVQPMALGYDGVEGSENAHPVSLADARLGGADDSLRCSIT
jgi:hypothetical protein